MGTSAAYVVTFRLEPDTTALGGQLRVVVLVPLSLKARRLRAVQLARAELWEHARGHAIPPSGLVSQAVKVERVLDAVTPGVLDDHERQPDPELSADARATLWSIGRTTDLLTITALLPHHLRNVVRLAQLGLVELDDDDLIRLTDAGRRELLRA